MQLKTRRLALAVTMLAVLVGGGCFGAKTTPQTDPTRNLTGAGRAAYQTTMVIKALSVVRDVAVEGEKQHIISPQSALKVIAYHRQTVQIMGAIPEGWKTVALKGLDQLKDDLTADEWKQIEPFVTLLQTLYNTFVPPGGPPSSSALWWTAHTHYQGGH